MQAVVPLLNALNGGNAQAMEQPPRYEQSALGLIAAAVAAAVVRYHDNF